LSPLPNNITIETFIKGFLVGILLKMAKKSLKKSEYLQFREKFAKYSPYVLAFEQANDPENPDIRGLKRLAVANVPDSHPNSEIERERVGRTNDIQVISKFFNIGYKRIAKDFEAYGDKNIKRILKKTPQKNLEMILASVELKRKIPQAYKSVAQIHQDYQEMYRVLAVYKNDESEEDDREKALKTMEKKVTDFYTANYSGNPEVLDALKYLAKVDSELKVARYMGFVGDKRKEFDNKVGDKLGPYLSDTVKDKLALYSMIASDLRKAKR